MALLLMLVLPMLQSFLHFDYAQCDEKDFRLCQVYFTRCYAIIYGLPAQALIIALVAAIFTIFVKKNWK